MANEKGKIAGISHGTVLARQKKDPEFQFHYVQRKFVHEVAVAIRAMRKQAGVTQAQLAEMVGVSQPMIAKIEKGIEQHAPNWAMLGKVCVALGKQMRLSFRDVEEQETHLVEVDGRPVTALEDGPTDAS